MADAARPGEHLPLGVPVRVDDLLEPALLVPVIGRERLADRCGAVLLSPVHGELAPRTLAEWVLADRLPVRVQLQVHKYIWSPETRGV